MTTTKEHARSVTRRITFTRDGNANASGSFGTFLPHRIQILLPLAHLLSSDPSGHAGSTLKGGTSVWKQVVKDKREDEPRWLGTAPLFRPTVSPPVCLPLQSNSAPPGLQGQLRFLAPQIFSFVYMRLKPQ